MKAQVALETLLLFGLFALIIIAILLGLMAIKEENDLLALSQATYQNLNLLLKTLKEMEINCPGNTTVKLRFPKEVELEIKVKNQKTHIILKSQLGELTKIYNKPVSVSFTSRKGNTIKLNIECSQNGVIYLS